MTDSNSLSSPGSTSPLLINGMDASALVEASVGSQTQATSTQPAGQFWATPVRAPSDLTSEVFEMTFTNSVLVNNVSVDLAHYPHRLTIELFDDGHWIVATDPSGEPVEVAVTDSSPAIFPKVIPAVPQGTNFYHPTDPSHWVHQEIAIAPTNASGIRLVLVRDPRFTPPVTQTENISSYQYISGWACNPSEGGSFTSSYDQSGTTLIPDPPRWACTNVNYRWNGSGYSISGIESYNATTDGSGTDYYPSTEFPGHQDYAVYTCTPEPTTYRTVTASCTPIYSTGSYVTQYQTEQVQVPDPQGWTCEQTNYFWNGTGYEISGVESFYSLTNETGTYYDYSKSQEHPDYSVYACTAAPLTYHTETTTMPVTVPAPVTYTDSPANYSLALRNLAVAYKIETIANATLAVTPEQAAAGITNPIITSYTDSLGGQVAYRKKVQEAANLINESGGTWQCLPQPTIDSVVNLYVDMRRPDGSGTVLDQFFVDPVITGATVNLYYSNDDPPVGGDPSSADFYEGMFWYPIPRDYVLQKGFLNLPPTLARFWNLEFTNLTAQPRTISDPAGVQTTYKVHPLAEARRQAALPTSSTSASSVSSVPGLSTLVINSSPSSPTVYTDTKYLPGGTLNQGAPSPTASQYVTDPSVRARLRRVSPVYGMTQTHPTTRPTRFTNPGVHRYRTLTTTQNEKVGYYVGLRALSAYRQDLTADDNTAEYVELFHDLQNVSKSTFTFEPNLLSMNDGQVTAQARSVVFRSSREVTAVQFASTQSDPTQVLPDQDLSDPSFWFAAGDASLSFEQSSNPSQGAVIAFRRGNGLSGGISSYPTVTSGGRLHAAARVYANSDLSGQVTLQILDGAHDVIASESVQVNSGQIIEWTASVSPRAGSGPYTVQVFQSGLSSDLIYLDALSLFEDGLLWEFSVDGGLTFTAAHDINCDTTGVLVFEHPGVGLVWRVTASLPRQFVSAVSIRPWYAGLLSGILPQNGFVPGGPDVNPSDQYMPIEQDPAWQQWGQTVPRWWYLADRM